jgi:hypothetical protein
VSLRVVMAIVLAGTSLVRPGALARQDPSPLVVDDPESYRVYASLLSSRWPGDGPKPKVVLIHQETSTSDFWFARGKPIERKGFIVSNGVARPLTQDEILARLPERTPVLDAYLAAQQTVRTLVPGQELGVLYKLVTARDITSGYIQMSAVGFDAAGTRAVVYMTYQCGGLCSRGALYLLEKINGGWREVARLGEWRS